MKLDLNAVWVLTIRQPQESAWEKLISPSIKWISQIKPQDLLSWVATLLQESLRKHLQSSFPLCDKKDSDSPPLGSLEACSFWHSSVHGKQETQNSSEGSFLFLPSICHLYLISWQFTFHWTYLHSRITLKCHQKNLIHEDQKCMLYKIHHNMYSWLEPWQISVCSRILFY